MTDRPKDLEPWQTDWESEQMDAVDEPSPYVVYMNYAGTEALTFAVDEAGRGLGWAIYHPPVTGTDNRFRVRFGNRARPPHWIQSLQVCELYVSTGLEHDLSGSLVRSLPFARMEAAVNQPRHAEALSRLLQTDLIYAAPLPEQYSWLGRPKPIRQRQPQLRLKIPTDFRKPDAFYATVAERFLHLTAFGVESPAQAIAAANAVPVGTVHRWVKEARNRGLVAAAPKDLQGGEAR